MKRRRRKEVEMKWNVVVGTLYVGTMTGKGQEIVVVMERKKIGVLCVQETHWKGQKAREMGNGYKLYYTGEDCKRNWVAIVLTSRLKNGVLKMNRESDRLIGMKLAVDNVTVYVVSAYTPQVGTTDIEKDDFWNSLGSVMTMIPRSETVWLGADLNGHVKEGNHEEGVAEVIRRYGVGVRNNGDRIVDLATVNQLAIANTFFKKRTSRWSTCTSGGRNTQVDYILCWRIDLPKCCQRKRLQNSIS